MILYPGMSRVGHLGVSDETVLHRFIRLEAFLFMSQFEGFFLLWD